MNQIDLDNIIKINPGLCDFGLIRCKEKANQSNAIPLIEVNICLDFLQKCSRSKTINHNRSSYGIKHIVERWAKRYVSNGAFIAAALYLQFKVCFSNSSSNISLNISEKYLNQLEKELARE